MKIYGWFFCFVPFFLTACATTNVKKNPGPHDHGFRYYRPKPYLLIQPTLPGTADKFAPDELVSISLAWLPDFSEEYSIRIRAGMGTNKTTFKLQDGWNLTEVNVDIDSKFAENVKAFGELIKAVAPKGFLPTPSANEGQPATAEKFVVRATNVPMGYYESVVGKGPDGVKRLYGWRYLGFAPYANCPLEPSGVECADCESQILYGLVFANGVMSFQPLNQIGHPNTARIGVPVALATPAVAVADPKAAAFNAKVITSLNKTYSLSLTDKDVGTLLRDRKFIVNIKVNPAVYDAITKKMSLAETEKRLSESFNAFAVEIGGDMSFVAEVHLAKK